MSYWIVAVDIDDAYVHEGPQRNKPKVTYLVVYKDLQYKYCDIEKEVDVEFDEIKRRPVLDFDFMTNPNTTIADLIEEGYINVNGRSDESLKNVRERYLKLVRYNPEGARRAIENANALKKLSDDDLRDKIRRKWEERREYKPEKIPEITEQRYATDAHFSKYCFPEPKIYTTMDQVLDTLYGDWTKLYKSVLS